MSRTRILVVGTLPPPLGGASVLVKQLVEGLSRQPAVEAVVLNTNSIRGSGWRLPFRLASALWRFFWLSREVDVVSIHISGNRGTSPAFLVMGTAAVVFCRVWSRPLIVRTFANRYLLPEQAEWAKRWTRAIFRASSLFLVETRGSLELAHREDLAHTRWFPNARKLEPLGQRMDNPRCMRWAYLGHVRPMKGLKVLMEAARKLPEGIQVDAYGHFWDGMSELDFEGERVRYCGAFEPEDVKSILAGYDALVLPTLYDSEGYPGVILEAYAAGIPVVASRVGGIPEIAEPPCGVLVPKGEADALRAAMLQWSEDPEAYQEALEAVKRYRERFGAERWAQTFAGWARKLAAGETPEAEYPEG